MSFTKKIGSIDTREFGKIDFYESLEYDKFKIFDGNRGVMRGHVNRLIKSMEEEILFSPIFVDKDLRIVDGQHRFEAFKDVGARIIYCVLDGVGLKQVTRYNINTKNWNDDDFLKMYVELDYPEYKTYLIFKEKYGLSHSVCKGLLGGFVTTTGSTYKKHSGGGKYIDGSYYDTFKSGQFVCKTLRRANEIANFIEKLQFDNRKSANFVSALLKIENVKYDRNRMIAVINSNAHRLNHSVKPTKDYLFLLSDLYNRHLGKESRVQFFNPSEILVYN
jgi:hypothetical protein